MLKYKRVIYITEKSSKFPQLKQSIYRNIFSKMRGEKDTIVTTGTENTNLSKLHSCIIDLLSHFPLLC